MWGDLQRSRALLIFIIPLEILIGPPGTTAGTKSWCWPQGGVQPFLSSSCTAVRILVPAPANVLSDSRKPVPGVALHVGEADWATPFPPVGVLLLIWRREAVGQKHGFHFSTLHPLEWFDLG